MKEYRQLHYRGKDIESRNFQRLENEEHILGEFKNMKKTPWKSFGNRLTDFIVISNKKLMNVFLVNANIFGSPDFMVDYIPITSIMRIEQTRTDGQQGVEITFLKDRGQHNLTIQLGNQVNNVIALINPMLSH